MSSNAPIAVEADRISKSYGHQGGRQTVLDGVTFRIRQGEFVSVLGPSGCGKSTLLNLLGGFELPDEGSIRLDGRPVERPVRQAVMMFQDYGLLPWRSVLGNVELGLEPLKLGASERRERALDYLKLVHLQDKAGLFPSQLSGGMKQRVALARALAVRPRVLLLDEPFAALDTFTRYYLQDELLSIQRRENVTMILVTHDIDEAVYLSDRILLLGTEPGGIRLELRIPAAKPRDRGHGEFQLYRKRILEQFRFAGSGSKEEFTI